MERNVLVPVDDSAPARAAIKHAVESHSDANLIAVHVLDAVEKAKYEDEVEEIKRRVTEKSPVPIAKRR